MRKIQSSVVITFLMLTISLLSSVSLAHAAGPSLNNLSSGKQTWSRTETRTMQLPKKLCDALLKRFPELASSPQACTVELVSKTVWVGTSYHGVHPSSSCPTGSTTHSATFYGPARLFGAVLRTTFSYPGNCTLPKVTFQNCTSGDWNYPPYTGVNNTYCGHYQDSSYNVVSEGDYTATYLFGGSDPFIIQSIANSQNNNVSDNFD